MISLSAQRGRPQGNGQRGDMPPNIKGSIVDESYRPVEFATVSLLSKTDSEARKLIDSLSEPKLQKGQVTAGISMFYFEERAQN